jgi:tetratricopeptide (TPR) repeat protein
VALPTGRFSQLRWLQNFIAVAAMVGAALLMGLGIIGYGASAGVWMFAAGGLVLFAAIWLMTVTPLILKMESNLARQLDELRELHGIVAQHSAMLEAIAENTRISDAAKSLARRDQELDALREAIRDNIRKEKWEAALNLIDEMERRFGYKEEADRVREELDDARNDRIQTKLSEAVEMIESHFQSHEWDRAQREIDRLVNALPDDSRVLSLQDRIKALKDRHKQELKAAWDDAVRRHDTDHAIDVLKELDVYLSPAEAQSLQTSARNVFKEKLLQVGIQFRFAVTERRWHDALTTGLELIRDFPNARMANEVREAMDTLRERARQAAEAQPTVSARPQH